MRMPRLSLLVFALALAGLGVIGLLRPDFVPVWNPVPSWLPAHAFVLRLGSAISLLAGIGLLIPRLAALAARLLLVTFVVWLVAFRLPDFLHSPAFEACWSVFPLTVFLAAALVPYVWMSGGWDSRRLPWIAGSRGLRLAQVLYGLALIFFGAAHFLDLPDTLALIPKWLPGHLFWACFTGGTFVLAGLAVVTGINARLAAALAAVQIGSFLLLVWIPILAVGPRTTFQWSEAVLNAALLAAAWVLADSYARPLAG